MNQIHYFLNIALIYSKSLHHTKRTTRNYQMLRIPIYKTAIARTFYFRTFKLWNSLHPSLKKKRT